VLCCLVCLAAAGVATQLDECRQWLRHTQGFVLQLLKQVQSFVTDCQPSCSSMDATTSMDASSSMDGGSCSTSTAPASAASLHTWRCMCQEASDALATVAESMTAGGNEVSCHMYHVYNT
jgi:hypothetical protein